MNHARNRRELLGSAVTRGRAALVLVIVVALGVAGAGTAFAFFSGSGGGSAAAQADALPKGATPGQPTTTPALSSNTVSVSFARTNTTTGNAPIPASNYLVRRYPAVGGSGVTASTACVGTTTITCTESSVPDGTWKYTDTPLYGTQWVGTESDPNVTPVTVDTSAPTASVTYPATSTSYGTNWAGAMTGTASDATSGVATVTVAIKNTTTNLWWGGSSFNQASQTFVPVTSGTTSWSLTFSNANLTTGNDYSVVAKATDNATNVATSSTVTFSYATAAPTVTSTVIGQSTGAAVDGTMKKNTGYFVYANVTDNSGLGIQSVAANVTNVTTGQTAVALTSAGAPFTSPNGATFAYRSAALTSNPAQADGAVSFTVNAKDNSNTSSTNTNNGTVTFDSTAPALSTLQMFDIDHNGKVDHVVATFNETLAACTAPCTTGWTLTSAPGGATLSSVTISGTQATLNLTEGTVNTAVGSFTVTLATTSGVIDNVSNHSSFAATAPADKAAPVATAVTLANGNGTVASNDTVAITYSEPLSFGSLCTTWAGAIISGNGNVDVTITNAGANDVLSLSSVGSCTGGTFRLGSIALGADYVNSDRTYTGNGSNQSQITWTAGSNTLTILLGGGSSGATGVAAAVPTYTPNAAITDNASPANAIATFSGAYASTRF